MSLYLPLPCCECTASTNPCDLPCFVSAVATISGSINVYASGNGNRISENFGPSFPVSSVPYTYTINFSLDTEINLNGFGNGQATVYALYDQQFSYSAGPNCPGEGCDAITVVNGIVTTGLSCPADVCDGGQAYKIGTGLSPETNDEQDTSCEFEGDQSIFVYFCDETKILSPTASVALSYVACATNGFTISFPIDGSVLSFSTTQGAQYFLIGEIFIDNLDPRPLYAGYGGFGNGAGCIGADTSRTIAGSLNVVIERTIGYVNQDGGCVAP
jgi:hypothetical protein